MARLQAGDAAGATVILEKVTAAGSMSATAWRLLGYSYRQTHRFDQSVAAYRRSLALEPNSAVAMYNLAGVSAKRAAVSGGRAYLYDGRDGHLIRTYTDRVPGDTFGFDAVGLGDVDGDGTVDFLITATWSGIHGNHSGRVFIISSGVK